ncbi:MAG TPA: indole-3-glycerol phosphate synthase TrpC [Dehalococcoidia bacterium]|jgi:indole-3-glycerol phosphate synthase|nr:indole-3-glycerol phosphate synthase TrpC [Dehalococcoidia bacterium]
MTQRTETKLDQIIADKREELAAAKAALPLADMRALAAEAPQSRGFEAALRQTTSALIAEVKKASPSRGLLRADFNPVALATDYAVAGASAISVLTDAKHFQGSLEDLRAIRQALPDGPPLLRKDFLFDEYQLYEARAAGADAVLLITAILELPLLCDLIALAKAIGMNALVEVHDEADLERAIAADTTIIGINNRDLRTFEVDLTTTEHLAPLAPAGATLVAESGIFKREDILRLQNCGVHAVLIGEALVTAPDPGAKIRELLT